MRLLDLFSGAGGAGFGYHRAGFEVVGVDIKPQPHYPFEFHQADALEYVAEHGHEFDAIHASPPCQAFSQMCVCRPGLQLQYPDLIQATRDILVKIGKPYVIENVGGARKLLNSPLMLCGLEFGLKVYRHRYFETKPYMIGPAHRLHRDNSPGACHGLSKRGFITVCGNGGLGIEGGMKYAKQAMGIEWNITRHEISEAIPPAYTEFIGKQLMRYLEVEIGT